MSNASNTNTDWTLVAALITVASFLGGFCILIWQIYGYLRFEIWRSLSLVDILRGFEMKWAVAPADWIGLYRILEWMPLSLLVPVVGVILAFIAGMQDEIN